MRLLDLETACNYFIILPDLPPHILYCSPPDLSSQWQFATPSLVLILSLEAASEVDGNLKHHHLAMTLFIEPASEVAGSQAYHQLALTSFLDVASKLA